MKSLRAKSHLAIRLVLVAAGGPPGLGPRRSRCRHALGNWIGAAPTALLERFPICWRIPSVAGERRDL